MSVERCPYIDDKRRGKYEYIGLYSFEGAHYACVRADHSHLLIERVPSTPGEKPEFLFYSFTKPIQLNQPLILPDVLLKDAPDDDLQALIDLNNLKDLPVKQVKKPSLLASYFPWSWWEKGMILAGVLLAIALLTTLSMVVMGGAPAFGLLNLVTSILGVVNISLPTMTGGLLFAVAGLLEAAALTVVTAAVMLVVGVLNYARFKTQSSVRQLKTTQETKQLSDLEANDILEREDWRPVEKTSDDGVDVYIYQSRDDWVQIAHQKDKIVMKLLTKHAAAYTKEQLIDQDHADKTAAMILAMNQLFSFVNVQTTSFLKDLHIGNSLVPNEGWQVTKCQRWMPKLKSAPIDYSITLVSNHAYPRFEVIKSSFGGRSKEIVSYCYGEGDANKVSGLRLINLPESIVALIHGKIDEAERIKPFNFLNWKFTKTEDGIYYYDVEDEYPQLRVTYEEDSDTPKVTLFEDEGTSVPVDWELLSSPSVRMFNSVRNLFQINVMQHFPKKDWRLIDTEAFTYISDGHKIELSNDGSATFYLPVGEKYFEFKDTQRYWVPQSVKQLHQQAVLSACPEEDWQLSEQPASDLEEATALVFNSPISTKMLCVTRLADADSNYEVMLYQHPEQVEGPECLEYNQMPQSVKVQVSEFFSGR